jgi:hypothetical protein
MLMQRKFVISIFCCALLLSTGAAQTSPAPAVRLDKASGELLVHGKPFVIFGGELGNSSAGTAAQADAILPSLARLHLNTVLMPVAWEQTEPTEGSFDFSILDHWIDAARRQNLHLVLLWFGSWKNAFSEYAPAWVKADAKRFPRALGIDGAPLEILSTFGAETLHADSRAFAALLAHLREKDAGHDTVLTVQVENEVGYLGPGRDRSPEADRAFASAVPADLMQTLAARRADLAPELAAHFNSQGKTWREVFGDAADEAFMAWRYAIYVDAVVAAGKKEYNLPLYLNAQLPAFLERAGDYPSGGPNPHDFDIYRAVASHIDFYSPDIYWPDFEYWVGRYQFAGNPVFVPEARMDAAPFDALYAYGAARAFGFSPFAIEHLTPSADESNEPLLAQVYAALAELGDLLPAAQKADRTRAIALHSTSLRGSQTVALGGYLFQASLSRAWGSGELLAKDGAMLVLESAPNEFLVVGAGLTVKITRDPDTDSKIAGIASVEEVSRAGADWKVSARLNGDQTNQGRNLIMDAHDIRIYRVMLYAVAH